jgi:drug/metabolite transporter (DMT)-like permease
MSMSQSPKMSPRTWLPAYLLLALIWGFSFYFIMVGLEAFTPVGVAFGRIAFGAATLVVLSVITKTPLPPRWSWKYIFIASLLWVSIPWMLFGFGETRVSSALAGIINGATPLMTLLAILIAFPEEKPNRQRIFGLAIGFIGILIVVGVWNLGPHTNDNGETGGTDLLGITALLIAITCYGIAFPFARKYLTGPTAREQIQPISLAMGMMIWGLIITTPIVAFTGVIDHTMTWPPLLAVAALGIFGSGVAYVLNFKVVTEADATTASTVTYLTPLVAVIAGALLLNETLSWNQPVGGLLVVVGAAIAQGVINGRIGTRGK